jgi:hypothetical protein
MRRDQSPTKKEPGAKPSCAAPRPASFLFRCLCQNRRQDSARFGREQGLTIKTGQTHVQAYTKRLMKRNEAGYVDPSFFA